MVTTFWNCPQMTSFNLSILYSRFPLCIVYRPIPIIHTPPTFHTSRKNMLDIIIFWGMKYIGSKSNILSSIQTCVLSTKYRLGSVNKMGCPVLEWWYVVGNVWVWCNKNPTFKPQDCQEKKQKKIKSPRVYFCYWNQCCSQPSEIYMYEIWIPYISHVSIL